MTLGSGGQQIDDLLNGFVGAVVGGFELAGRLVMRVGAVMEAAVGERAAEALVKEQKEQGDPGLRRGGLVWGISCQELLLCQSRP